MGEVEQIRAFIALNPPAELRRAFGEVQRRLQTNLPDGLVRWTPPGQIHMTLRFLGAVPADAVAAIQHALDRACAGTLQFDLAIEGIGCFPNTRQPKVIWVGIGGAADVLIALQKRIEDATAAWGVVEERVFRPHLTMGRVKPMRPRSRLAFRRAFEASPEFSLHRWQVQRVDLMRSDLSAEGATHTCLHSVALDAVTSPPAHGRL